MYFSCRWTDVIIVQLTRDKYVTFTYLNVSSRVDGENVHLLTNDGPVVQSRSEEACVWR